MRKILCLLGFHKLGWYSQYDKDLFVNGQDTGPLMECIHGCGYHSRVEYSCCNGKNIKEITLVLAKEQREENEISFMIKTYGKNYKKQ